MTTVFLSSPTVTVNAVDLTDQCTSATFSQSVDALEKTVFGNVARLYTGGLQTNELTLEMFLDYDAGDVWATLNGLVGVATTVKVKAASGAASATNPELTLTGAMLASLPQNFALGELQTVSVTFQGGAYTANTGA
jgi:hypothetical protein